MDAYQATSPPPPQRGEIKDLPLCEKNYGLIVPGMISWGQHYVINRFYRNPLLVSPLPGAGWGCWVVLVQEEIIPALMEWEGELQSS